MRPLLFLLIWTLFVLLALPGAYWRDGAEFVTSAALLDVPHVAGFPIYNLLANIFTLIPVGPISWRVNVFSSAISTAHLALLALLIARIAHRELRCTPRVGSLIGALTATLLLASEAYLRQSLTAEVYMLNSAFIVGLLIIAHEYLHSRDARLLPVLALTGALALGNHLSIALIIVPSAFAIGVLARPHIQRTFGAALLATLLGLSSYLYVPVRASLPLALSTGSPVNGERLWGYFTNVRDRDLRPAAAPAEESGSAERLQPVLGTLASDFARLQAEIAPELVLAAGIGAVLLLVRGGWVIGSLIVMSGIGNMLFFQGWESDPWIPAVAMLYALIGAGIAAVTGFFATGGKQGMVALALLFIVSLPAVPTALLGVALSTERVQQYDAPTQRAAQLLLALPPHAVLATESQWFPIRYLQAVEGVRTDILTVHTPELLFPRHFRTFDLTRSDGTRLHSAGYGERVRSSPNALLSDFVSFVGKQIPLFLEPSPLINGLFRAIAILHPSGLIELRQGTSGGIDPGFSPAAFAMDPGLSIDLANRDAIRSAEMSMGALADLLAQKARPELAAALLEVVCGDLRSAACSPITLNNLGVYWLRSGRAGRAEELFEYIIDTSPTLRAAAQTNLALTRSAKGEGSTPPPEE